jgi:hypothetical protein
MHFCLSSRGDLLLLSVSLKGTASAVPQKFKEGKGALAPEVRFNQQRAEVIQ